MFETCPKSQMKTLVHWCKVCFGLCWHNRRLGNATWGEKCFNKKYYIFTVVYLCYFDITHYMKKFICHNHLLFYWKIRNLMLQMYTRLFTNIFLYDSTLTLVNVTILNDFSREEAAVYLVTYINYLVSRDNSWMLVKKWLMNYVSFSLVQTLYSIYFSLVRNVQNLSLLFLKMIASPRTIKVK